MRRARLFAYLLMSGAMASLAGGFLAALFGALLVIGVTALLPPGWFIGIFGAALALKLATLPAAVLGGLLWHFRVRSKWAWAGTGALAGLGLFLLVRQFPGLDNIASDLISDPEAIMFAPGCLFAGAFAALVFRVIMEALTSFDDALSLD